MAALSEPCGEARRFVAGGPNDPRNALYGRPTLSAAMRYFLLVGRMPPAGCRLPGWVSLAQHEFDAPFLWSTYGDALVSEAQAAGFTPYWLQKKVPKGDGFLRWRGEFLKAHRY